MDSSFKHQMEMDIDFCGLAKCLSPLRKKHHVDNDYTVCGARHFQGPGLLNYCCDKGDDYHTATAFYLTTLGMVHAWVGQKLLKRNKIKRFFSGDQFQVRNTVLTNTNAIAKPLVHMIFLYLDPPNKLYTHLSKALLFRLICNTPIEIRVLSVDLQPFCTS
jgi:hypothetical protein